MNDRPGKSLTEQERRHVARQLIVERLSDVGEWLLWEDVPELGEFEFERLVDEVAREVGEWLLRATESTLDQEDTP